jgi:hypothetical protein
MAANLDHLDWSEYWGHITGNQHNDVQPRGNASTFGGDTQANVRDCIEFVLTRCTPYFNNDRLVFDSTTGGICNGLHYDGARTNLRVIVRVSDVVDHQPWGNQVAYMVVENAYPIH